MADNKKPSPYGTDTGSTDTKFKLPTYEQTSPEGEACGTKPSTPMKSMPLPSVVPYGKDAS